MQQCSNLKFLIHKKFSLYRIHADLKVRSVRVHQEIWITHVRLKKRCLIDPSAIEVQLVVLLELAIVIMVNNSLHFCSSYYFP
jgi:hypothetical protein